MQTMMKRNKKGDTKYTKIIKLKSLVYMFLDRDFMSMLQKKTKECKNILF